MLLKDFTNGLRIKSTMFLVQSLMAIVTWSDMVPNIPVVPTIVLQAAPLICQKYATIHMQ